MRAEWEEYTGSPEQIEELRLAEDGVLLGTHSTLIIHCKYWKNPIDKNISEAAVKHYLICRPHPLANMICHQARTGRPVFYKRQKRDSLGELIPDEFKFGRFESKVDWDQPDTEFSFSSLNVR